MEPLSNLPSDALDGFLRPDANEYLVLIASIRATNDFSGRSMIGCRSLSRQFTTTAGFSPLDSGPRDLLVPFTSEPWWCGRFRRGWTSRRTIMLRSWSASMNRSTVVPKGDG